MIIPILIAVTLLLMGIGVAFVMLNKPKKQLGKSVRNAKKSKAPKNDEAFIQAALKRLEKDPEDAEALLALGEKYYNQQDWEKALKTYEILCETTGKWPGIDYFEIHFRCGEAAAKLELWNEAQRCFIVAANFNESDHRVQYELGNLSFRNGNYEKAVSHLAKSVSLNPEYAPALRVLGYTYFKLKKFKEAMANIRKALDVVPGDKETLYTLAECYEESGQTEQAVRIYSHLRADPQWGAASCLAAGKIHLSAQHLDEAVSDFEIGLKHKNIESDTVLELHYLVAVVCLRQDDISKALLHLNLVVDENPSYRDASKLIEQYAELNANQNLQLYVLSPPDEFLGLCRKIVLTFYSKAKVKITQTNVTGNEWADILAEISTPRWSSIVGFRFFRTQGSVGELVVRDFHAHLKNVKADKGICFAAGQFSSEARYFTEARLIELIDRSRLTVFLANVPILTTAAR
jgi:tetratricopeptide (TPR) repeat protein